MGKIAKNLGIKIKEIENEYLNKCGEYLTVKRIAETLRKRHMQVITEESKRS